MFFPPAGTYGAMRERLRAGRRTTRFVGERPRALLFGVLLLIAFTASADNDVRMHVGDDLAWAARSFDDSQWARMPIERVPQPDDAVWMRFHLTLRERTPGRPTGVYFAALASHEIFWDGVRIGGGGIVGRTKAAERPGPIEAHYQVPDALAAPGPHLVAVRASAFHRGFTPVHGYWALIAGDYDKLLTLQAHSARLALTALSGIVLTGVFAFAMFWLARRDRSFLLLGTLCLAAAALLLAESSRQLIGYTYDWHIVRLRAIVALSWLTGVQLVALLVARFPHRRGSLVLGVTALAATIVPLFPKGWDPKSGLIFFVCCLASLCWTLFAVVRRMHGSALAAIGIGVAMIAIFYDPGMWLDANVYFALDFLFLCLLCSHALEVRRERDEKARLELEMLRRHLQPHFLMNTLTALSEWIEAEPQTAVRMIEALAGELRTLGEMSARRLVTADEELRLCRAHLANMSLRKDVAYELEVDGVDGARLVPPAVFHTLVENAVTHGETSERVTLRLSAHGDGSRIRYVFEAPAASDDDEAPRGAGGGTRYIEARLREVFGNAWSFRQGRIGAQWRAEIEVPA
ncbi:MAG TPA: histidine kinase [Thermoanaerobaculia bacterium]